MARERALSLFDNTVKAGTVLLQCHVLFICHSGIASRTWWLVVAELLDTLFANLLDALFADLLDVLLRPADAHHERSGGVAAAVLHGTPADACITGCSALASKVGWAAGCAVWTTLELMKTRLALGSTHTLV